MNLHELGDIAMGMKIAFIVFLVVGFCAYAVPAGARGGSQVLPPQEVLGQIRVVDRIGGRIVMEERNLEVFATDPRQLDGLAEGQKVRLRFQQQDGRQVINSIVPVPK
jgi:Cu/Ag efflux protein CusF